jgi:hypothetical protein
MIRSVSVAAVLLAVAAPVALAGASAKDPKALVLRQSDFPRGTRVGNAFGVNGPLVSQYAVGFEIRPGDIQREEDVSVQLWVAKDVAGAKNLYRQTIGANTGLEGEATLKLPGYGDEQFADYLPNPSRPHGQLIVRRNRVVWYLTVENCTPLSFSCYGTSRTEKPIGQAKAAAELKRYATKQKARIGKG